jgi:hypothetical protein
MTPAAMDHTIDQTVHTALVGFVDEINRSGWRGREREAVSLFAFGALAEQCRAGTWFQDLRQIGIEVAVPQLPGEKRKRVVCKDLVLWPKPGMTCWTTEQGPVSVLEWKTSRTKPSSYDVQWLRKFSEDRDEFVGYALALMLSNTATLSVTRVAQGQTQADWLRLKA